MYRCDIHGVKDKDWCEECHTPLQCDCSTTETARWKDLPYGDDIECHTNVYLSFCPACGEPKGVSLDPL